MMIRPEVNEYAAFYRGYVDLVPETNILPVLEEQPELLRRFAGGPCVGREDFAYAPGKWTVREVLGHLGDGERVFGYRAFRFSRADTTPLPGFDENHYVQQSPFGRATLDALVGEFVHLRLANLAMLRALRDGQWAASGQANNNVITVRALVWVMAGHVRHHLRVLRERYGIAADG